MVDTETYKKKIIENTDLNKEIYFSRHKLVFEYFGLSNNEKNDIVNNFVHNVCMKHNKITLISELSFL